MLKNKLPKYTDFFKENRSFEQALNLYKLRIAASNEIYKKFSKNFILRNCPICNFNEALNLPKFNKKYGVVCCNKCNSLYVNPAPNIESLEHYYNKCKCNSKEILGKIINNHHSKKNFSNERLLAVLGLIKEKLKKKKKLNILEIGAHSGAFIKSLNHTLLRTKYKKMVDIVGIDIDSEAVNNPVSKNLSLYHSSAEKFLKKTIKRFDIVLHFELIEHLIDPFKFIRSAHKLLNDKGIMYFHTPNILGLDNVALSYNKFRPLAHGIFPPMHLNAFSTQNITNFVIRAGFKLKSIETPGNFDVDIVKYFAKNNDLHSMLNNFKDKQTLKIIQSLIRKLRASSHMAVTTYKN